MATALTTVTGTITEIGQQTSAFLGSRYSYIRLQDLSGKVHDVPGIIALNALEPHIRQGASVTLAFDRCWFTTVGFGIKVQGQKFISIDIGPLKLIHWWCYIMFAVAGAITLFSLGLLLPVGLLFAGIGWFIYSNARVPKPEEIEAALDGPLAPAPPPIRN